MPTMQQQDPIRNFDQEVASMMGLATALTGDVASTPYVFPMPPLSTLPGITIVTSEYQGEQNADKREDSR